MANTRTPTKPSLADITAATKPIEKSVMMCVAGDLFAEWERLEEELSEAQQNAISRSRGAKLNAAGDPEKDPEVLAKAKAIQALQAKMKKSEFEFRFRKLPGSEWDDLLTAHQPRDGDDGDNRRGYNRSTFPQAAVRACCVSPDMSDTAEFDEFWAKLNSGQRDLLFIDGALPVNRDGGVIPKSVNASAVIRASAQSSGSASA